MEIYEDLFVRLVILCEEWRHVALAHFQPFNLDLNQAA